NNNAGTTLKDGDTFVTINAALDYEISFRAKWLSGSNQLNSRLYFNRLARTTKLDVPDLGGTPGMPNSVLEENLGPTYGDLNHGPAVPLADEDVTVTVVANDPDGIEQMTLFWKRNANAWHEVAMTDLGDGLYSGVIPGKRVKSLMQFYVQGTDTRGAISMFPAAGPESRAIYRVVEARSELGGVHNFRIVMTDDDTERLHEITNVMSNDRIGATVIYDESEIFYDVGVRLKGSERGRWQWTRVGFNVQFDPQQLFRGVHRTVAIDRSGAGDQFSQKEILVKQGINHAGGIPGMYDDIVNVDAPKTLNTGSALLVMARYNDVFLDSQFENGSQGTAFEYELIYYPLRTVDGDVEGLKVPNSDSVVGAPVANLGDDKEAYRWHWIIKNNRLEDDYSGLIEVVTAIGQPAGEAFHRDTQRLLDVDQWLRAFAVQIVFGIGDNYATAGGPWHNMQLYIPPDGGKALFFPWDMDFTFSQNPLSDIVGPNGDLRKMLTDPNNEHAYFGHVLDILDTTFNIDYMGPWMEHYSSLLPREDLTSFTRYITDRSAFAREQLPPQIPFELATDGPIDVGADRSVTLNGTGWIDVREIRLAGSDQPLTVNWSSVSDWELTLPVDNRVGEIVLEATNRQGQLVGTDTVVVRSTAVPERHPLVISEMDYHPSDPTAEELATDPALDAKDFEFIELVNRGDEPLDLTGYQFTSGIEFTFSSDQLAPGEIAVLVRDRDAFALRYGAEVPVVGEFASGKLSNRGETVELVDGLGTVVDRVSYADQAPWPVLADGRGEALVRTTDRSDGELPSSWYGQAPTPGSTQFVAAGDADRNGVIDADDVGAFVLALTDPRQYRLTHGLPAVATSDLDGDGDVDYDDIAGLALLVTAAPQAAVARNVRAPLARSVSQREAADPAGPSEADRTPSGHRRWMKRVDRALTDETSWLPRGE
ncbi:MAG: lamin tail domain-containing protein, partial [Pirellulales bacterium]